MTPLGASTGRALAPVRHAAVRSIGAPRLVRARSAAMETMEEETPVLRNLLETQKR